MIGLHTGINNITQINIDLTPVHPDLIVPSTFPEHAMAQSIRMLATERQFMPTTARSRGPVGRAVVVCAVQHSNQPVMEKLLGAQKLQILDHAEHDLSEYCSNIKSKKERQKCFEVVNYYHDKRNQASSGCANELASKGSAGSNCQQLDSLEKMVYEVAYTGGAENLYQVLKAESAAAKRRASGTPSPATQADLQDQLHTKAATLFEIVDANGNGVIDREELLSAMALLECKLSEDELGLVLSCMDCHGHITLDQFTDIVAAESMRKPDSDAEVLRHLPHSRPGWWSECPPSIDNL